jgi:hypothetical protein
MAMNRQIVRLPEGAAPAVAQHGELGKNGSCCLPKQAPSETITLPRQARGRRRRPASELASSTDSGGLGRVSRAEAKRSLVDPSGHPPRMGPIEACTAPSHAATFQAGLLFRVGRDADCGDSSVGRDRRSKPAARIKVAGWLDGNTGGASTGAHLRLGAVQSPTGRSSGGRNGPVTYRIPGSCLTF